MSVSYRRGSAIVIALAAAVLTAVLAFTGGAGPAAGAERSPNAQSGALTVAPSLDRKTSQEFADAAQSRAAAARAAGHVPLPEGGNVNGIRWEELGGQSAAEIETFVEYNAFCQWLRASRDPGQRVEALSVLDDVPSWPAFRDQPDVELIRQIVAQAHAGGGAVFEVTVADCDRSHDAEIGYAAKLRLPASS